DVPRPPLAAIGKDGALVELTAAATAVWFAALSPQGVDPIVFGTKFAPDVGVIFALCLHAYPETAGMAGRQRWRDDVDEICNQVTSRVWSTSTRLHPYWRGSRTSAPSATVRATASCSLTSTSVSSCSTSSVPRSPACAPFSRRQPLRLSSDDWGFGLHRLVRLARLHGCLTPAPCTKSCKNWPVRPRRLSTGRMLNSCSISQPWTAVSFVRFLAWLGPCGKTPSTEESSCTCTSTSSAELPWMPPLPPP